MGQLFLWSIRLNETRIASGRARFWLGFALAFTLLLLASCGALFVASGLDEVSLAELQGGGPVWTPPPVTPTSASSLSVEASDAASVPDGRFRPGQQARNVTNSRVNVRAAAGYLAKPADDVRGQLPPGALVEIVGPSATVDGLTWWLVRGPSEAGAALEGWVAEATASGVTILGQ
jgi:hypothetical protein